MSFPLVLVSGKATRSLARDSGFVGQETRLEVLNEHTFETLLPKLGDNTLVFLESGFNFGRHHQDVLKAIRESDTSVVVKDCKAGELVGIAAVSPEGELVAMKSSCGGHRQKLLVINGIQGTHEKLEEEGEEGEGPGEEEEGPGEEGEGPGEEEEGPGEEEGEGLGEEGEGPGGEEVERKEGVHPTRISELKYYHFLIWGENKRYEPPPDPWEYHATISFSNNQFKPQHKRAPKWVKKCLSKGKLKCFCTIHVSLFASENPRSKWIRFRLTDAVGMGAEMGSNDERVRGFFNHSATVCLFPGVSKVDPHDSSFPADNWCRPYMEPHTPNSETTYTSTTGWSIGAKASTTASAANSLGAEITTTYDQSEQVTCTIKDFSVRNISDGVMTGWKFYYTAMDEQKWKNHFKWNIAPKEIADLAKSTLTLNAEAVYQCPAKSDQLVPWNAELQLDWTTLKGSFFFKSKYTTGFTIRNGMVIDTGIVQVPRLTRV